MDIRKIWSLLGHTADELDEHDIDPDMWRRIQHESGKPIDISALQHLFKELSVRRKLAMAAYLNIQIKVSSNRSFPDLVFQKTALMKSRKEDGKKKLFVAILMAIMPVYEKWQEDEVDDEEASEAYIKERETITRQYGPWHYYWGLLFLMDRTEEVEREIASFRGSESKEDGEEGKTAEGIVEPEGSAQELSVNDVNNVNDHAKRAAQLEQLLGQERARRLQAETEKERLSKALRLQESHSEQLAAAKDNLVEKLAALRNEHEEFVTMLESKRQQVWLLEKNVIGLEQQARRKEQDLQRLQSALEGSEQALKEAEFNLHKERNRPVGIRELTVRMLDRLYLEVKQISHSLSSQGQEGRQRLRSMLDLVDKLEEYKEGEGRLSLQSARNEAAVAAEAPAQAPALDQSSQPGAAASLDENDLEAEDSSLYGTFYRRNHGGYIMLEHEEMVNITESMVIQLHLEHEAEVRCIPKQTPVGTNRYDIELVLQGDDSLSPVQQFDGYIEIGEHFVYYCVDMNNSDHRYPLHMKDIEIQQPRDGDPCLFNISEESRFARLSRLYRLESTTQRAERSSKTRPHASKSLERRDKPEPFLTGCKIVIVGGQHKWFESVVKETGAELIHEPSDQPHRMHAGLRRAQAMFMLLTATSHQATWSCMEIAKQYGVPHFTIHGSKTNLRQQLWDNRLLIQQARERNSH
ncbi:hypothetical protein ACFO9Q_18630 [Paenibacillus sp. GCM10023252]|uniref:DUF2325 domain-containing protein n=1 Tax=Paenibacillus sp. GCM10023252 TaxID=3252649 RepID=UPI003618CF0E